MPNVVTATTCEEKKDFVIAAKTFDRQQDRQDRENLHKSKLARACKIMNAHHKQQNPESLVIWNPSLPKDSALLKPRENVGFGD
jgi:hypothetical protein